MQATSVVLLSGQMALSRSMDIIANNVANSSTTGFKREGIEFDTYLARTNPGKPGINFVVDRATYRDVSNGPIVTTGNPLDLAIEGRGYFQVQLPNGTTGYTRGGAFQLNNEGQLVTQAGYPVLNDGGQPITFPETTSQINIGADGFISARIDNGKALAELGKVGVFTFPNEQQMQSAGSGVYSTTQQPTARADDPNSGSVTQGSIEESNVKPVAEMTTMIQIQRAYEQVTNMISMANDRMTTALDKLSQTSA